MKGFVDVRLIICENSNYKNLINLILKVLCIKSVLFVYYMRNFATNINIIAMETTHSLDRVIQPKTKYPINKENKLQKVLRSKKAIQLTAKQHENYRLRAYEAVR